MNRGHAAVLPVVDHWLLTMTLSLLAIGLVAIASASIEYSAVHFSSPWFQAGKHAIFIAVGLCAGVLAYTVPTDFWARTSQVWLLIALALLVLVLIPGIGREVKGSQRWFPLGPVNLQPSEVAKLALVIYTSGYLARHGPAVLAFWHGLARPLMVLMLVAVLLLLEPDFGATVICSATVVGLLFLAGAAKRYVVLMVGLGLSALAILAQSSPYRLERLTAYTNPWSDPFDTGFQLTQSLIAYGRGEWVGVGLGNSIQKLFYLPEAHTDFVFSIWAEETGLLGAVLVMLLYAGLIGRMIWVGVCANRAQQVFASFVSFGVALIFAGQAFVNMGVSSGLLPTKGLTLPLISYGGSSMLISCVMLGMVMRIATQLPTPDQSTRRKERGAQ
jgi:cell division protein FtsW